MQIKKGAITMMETITKKGAMVLAGPLFENLVKRAQKAGSARIACRYGIVGCTSFGNSFYRIMTIS
jgi:hypothetical protein